MEITDKEIEFLKKLKVQRQVRFNKVTDKNSSIRIIAESLKNKGLIQIEDISNSETFEFAQLTRKGKKIVQE